LSHGSFFRFLLLIEGYRHVKEVAGLIQGDGDLLGGSKRNVLCRKEKSLHCFLLKKRLYSERIVSLNSGELI